MIQSTPVRACVNTLVLYTKLLLSTVIAFFNIPLLLQALGADNYGIFCVVGGFIALLMFLSYTMTTATNRFLAVAEGRQDNFSERQKIFNLCLLLHLAIALLLVIVLEIVALCFWDKILNIAQDRQFAAKVVFQTMLISTFLSIATIPYTGIIIAKERMVFFALVTLLASIAKLGITVLLFAFKGDRLILYAVLLLGVISLERFSHILYAHHLSPIHYDFRHPDHSLFREMATFFGWSMTINFSLPAVINGTSVLLNKFFGVLVNAAEGIAIQVAGQLAGICSNLLNAITPIIMKREGGKKVEQALTITLSTCRCSAYLLILISSAAFWEMPYLLKLWLKDVPPYTLIFCRLILLRVILEQITLPLAILMNANGKIKWMQICSSGVYLFTLATEAAILAAGASPCSVYYCLIAMMIAVGVIRVICVNRYYAMPVSVFFTETVLRIAGVFICGMASALWISRCMAPSIRRCCATFGISIFVILFCIALFGFTVDERTNICNGLRRIRNRYREKQEQRLE